MSLMLDSNSAIVSVSGEDYGKVLHFLRRFGRVRRTGFFNVLVLDADDGREALLDRLHAELPLDPRERLRLSRVSPIERAFAFDSRDDLEQKLATAAEPLAARLGGKSFHVRMHRRGLKGAVSSHDEEVFLDRALLSALEKAGTPGRIAFDDPDAIVVVETLGRLGGIAMWSREDLRRWPLLHVEGALARPAA